jgi:hypothetical protein
LYHTCATVGTLLIGVHAKYSAFVALLHGSTMTKFVPSYLSFVLSPATISPSTGSLPSIVLIFFAQRPFTSIVQAPVFVVIASSMISIPSIYSVGVGVSVTT